MPSRAIPIHPTLGPKIRAWREIRGLSLRDLAERSGRDASEIERFELQRRNPSYPVVVALARALELPVEILWDHSPPPGRWTELALRRQRPKKSPPPA